MQGVMYVTGKLGGGKGIYLMHQAHQYYRAGRRVAANFDINTEHISNKSDNSIFRIPDRPRIEDLELLGRGCPEGEKEAFGCLLLDEAGTWLNCRNFRDKGRKELLDWFIHARKMGWDVYVGVQNEGMVDNQIFSATGEHITFCQRAFNIRVPFFSDLLEIFAPKSFGRMAKKRKRIFPHYVTARSYKGSPSRTNKPIEKVLIKASDYYDYYDTNYVFTEQQEFKKDGSTWDARASFSILPGSTLFEWYKPKL
ncbi:zonular occludens toxin domain-containing protein, partial [Acinetobacter venetianus]|uniref:zonular occludens toxin domain-containing protein n=1 Tax=Acinetobacter venetianus TaxID=52133 RepID=UPI003A8EC62E